jgi:hypothetical protein
LKPSHSQPIAHPRGTVHEQAETKHEIQQAFKGDGQEPESENERQGGRNQVPKVRDLAAPRLIFEGDPTMNKAKSVTKARKSPKRKPKSLKVRTNVKAGGTSWGTNRCETLQRQA